MANKVSICNDRGKIRIRWQHQGKSKSLNLGMDYITQNLGYAESVKRQILQDLATGQYDESLVAYRPRIVGKNATNIEAIKLFQKYRKTKELAYGTEQKYNATETHIQRFFDGDLVGRIDGKLADKFRSYLLRNVSPDTAKTYLWLVRDCWEWAKGQYAVVEEDIWSINDIKSGRVIKREPFDEQEVELILNTFKSDKYYAHYWPFMVALFSTAARPGELSQLDWKDVSKDFSKVSIWSNKTMHYRTVWLSSELSEILKDLSKVKKNEIVFLSPKGKRISTEQLRKRGWAKILDKAGIEYRPIYVARHSAISIALSKGVAPIDVAAQAGDSLTTIVRHYASSIRKSPVFGTDITSD